MGCAGQKESQAAARATLGETVRYEQEVDAKIAAENAFYEQENELLTEAANHISQTSELNIENSAMAELVAKIEAENGNGQAPEISQFARNLVTAIRAKEIEAAQYSRQVASASSSLQSLDMQKAGLTAVRNDLEQLQAGPSTKQQLQSWIEFGKAVQKEAASEPSGKKTKARSTSSSKPSSFSSAPSTSRGAP